MSTDASRTAPGDAGPRAALAARAPEFARVATANLTREYPNAPAHLLGGPDELIPPRAFHPAFYGAYDWHSSVHMHWLLVRLLRRCPALIDAAAVTDVLNAHLTPQALAVEADYLRDHPSFERPYGWAWLLALTAECGALAAGPDTAYADTAYADTAYADTAYADTAYAEAARRWYAALAPAARTVSGLVRAWLPKATYPVRHGTHANSAFALGLLLDSAEAAGVPELTEPVREKIRAWYLPDHGAATRWEPSGQDFLSPLLTEADAVRRTLPAPDFADWLAAFLPELAPATGPFLTPPRVSDPADPQIGHLLGLCLSRAAALTRIGDALPTDDPRTPVLAQAAEAHLSAGLPAATSGDFTTDHWLATFATLALEA